MTVWLYQRHLSPEAQATITEQALLVLPVGTDIPDLTGLHSLAQCKQMLAMLTPGSPPEQIHRQAEKLWQIRTQLQPEDIIVVPLPATQEIAIADVTSYYRYDVGPQGEDVHAVKVSWNKRLPTQLFGKDKSYFSMAPGARETLIEIENKELRIAIHNRLERSYNRFARWRWILVVVVVIKIIAITLHMMQRNGI